MTRRNKFNATPVMVDGIKFASKREAMRYGELKTLERAGHIEGLRLQPEFPLIIEGNPVLIRSKGYPKGRAAKYTADFDYLQGNQRIVEDVKGFDTPASRLRRAVVEAIYGINIWIV